LNHEVTGDFVVSKGNPIFLEREIYISNEDLSIQKDCISFTEILVEVNQPVPLNNVVAFSMTPYLKPQDDLLDFSSPNLLQ